MERRQTFDLSEGVRIDRPTSLTDVSEERRTGPTERVAAPIFSADPVL
jgi:hypothetical protein